MQRNIISEIQKKAVKLNIYAILIFKMIYASHFNKDK